MRRTLVAAGLALAAAPALAADAPLERLIAFKDVRQCAPAPDLARLIDSLFVTRRRGENDIFVLGAPAVPPAFRGQLGAPKLTEREPYCYEATVPLRGRWQGLQVRELYRFGMPESDFEGFAIRFAATPAEVRAAVNRLGFSIPASGKREEGDELTLYVSVRPAPGGAELACSTG